MNRNRLFYAMVVASTVSFGAIVIGDTPHRGYDMPDGRIVYSLKSDDQPRGLWGRTRAWVGRHPAIAGAIAGGAAGTTIFPGIGTIGGAIAGLAIGTGLGEDERDERADEREQRDWERERAKEEEDQRKPPDAGRQW